MAYGTAPLNLTSICLAFKCFWAAETGNNILGSCSTARSNPQYSGVQALVDCLSKGKETGTASDKQCPCDFVRKNLQELG